MAKIPEFNENMDIISGLGDVPGTDDNLTTEGLKAKFDLAGKLLKGFINAHIVPAINNYISDNSGLLSREGGQMEGPIDMNLSRIENLPHPVAPGDAAPRSFVESAVQKVAKDSLAVFSAELGTVWIDSNGTYVQTVSVPGVLESDRPHITPVYSKTKEIAVAQKESWSMVCDACAIVGAIKFECWDNMPTTAVPLQIEVNR